MILLGTERDGMDRRELLFYIYNSYYLFFPILVSGMLVSIDLDVAGWSY